jgi:hypothetical protein
VVVSCCLFLKRWCHNNGPCLFSNFQPSRGTRFFSQILFLQFYNRCCFRKEPRIQQAQCNSFGYKSNKAFNFAGNRQVMYRLLRVVGFNGYSFCQRSSTITRGIDFYGNFSLATGRDLSRIRDSRTPSPGFNLFNLKRICPLVVENIIMDDIRTV